MWCGGAWRLGLVTVGLAIIGGSWTGGVVSLVLRGQPGLSALPLICIVTIVAAMSLLNARGIIRRRG